MKEEIDSDIIRDRGDRERTRDIVYKSITSPISSIRACYS